MRVLVAARLSQLAEGQTGLDSQDAESTRWAEANGHSVVHVAADRKSGTSQPWDRKNLRPWVTDADKIAKYDAVLAYRLDRLSRGDNASTNAIEKWAHDHGKQLLTVDGLVFPCEGKDGIRWDVTKRIAHEEWLGTSEKYKRMTAYLRSEGKLTGPPPWGFEVAPAEDGNHKIMVPTDDGRKYVPEIFARCIAGESTVTIAKWMTEQNVTPPSKRKNGKNVWHSSTVERIIKNPAYMGRRSEKIRNGVYGKTILRCEVLVDASIFRRANDALRNRPKRGPQKPKKPENGRAMLAECLWCLRCGAPMYRATSGPGYLYYRCHGKGTDGAYRRGCGNMIRLGTLDAIVSARMARATRNITETRVIPGHDWSAELEEIRLEIRELASLDLTDAEYDAQLTELRAERDRLLSLPVEPDRTEEIDTGVSYAAMWAKLGDQERGDWLRKSKVSIWAMKGSQADVDAIAETSGIFGPDDAPPDVVDGVAVFMPAMLFRAAKNPPKGQ